MKSATRSKSGPSRRTILRTLGERQDLLRKHAVRRIGLFGSFAKGTQTARSDIDFLVEFEAPTYVNFVGLCRDLERLFDRKVEVLTPAGLASIRVRSIADDIRKTVVYG